MSAIEISNAVDQLNAPGRTETYLNMVKKYTPSECEAFGEMLAEVVYGMDENPDQDFLGELYMGLDLGNEHRGQFFTPYNVCKMMGKMMYGDVLQERVKQDGWISVSDPCCGAGALLIAFANTCKESDVNFQTSVLFVAQDIDYVVGCMCYLQLSLMGCAGYVVIDNSLTKPSLSHDKRGLIPVHSSNVWYTPFYFRNEWHLRRIWAQMDMLVKGAEKDAPADPPKVEKKEPESVTYQITEGEQLTLF